jgi:chemotaxis protein methyltransferase CheR
MTPETPQIAQAIQLIESRIGLSATTLERIGLSLILQQASSGDIESYLRQLQSTDEHSPAWQRLIYALTIGETYFLRDSSHFNILRENILPRLLLQRRQQNDLRLNIWVVGCATGEEAYSIATTLSEHIPDLSAWRINLYATDINQRAIDAAKRAVYREWSFRHTPPAFKQRYFTQVEDGWQLSFNIQKMVTFLRMNVLSGTPTPQADIIFCRHVLMYFSKAYAQKAEANLHHALSPGGWLVMGQAEALRSKRESWILHMFPGTPIYQKAEHMQRIEPISYPTRPEKVNKAPAPETSALYLKAVDAIHHDQADSAEVYLSELLEDAPQHPRAHMLSASILANRQAYPEAMTHIEAALSADGLLADAHYIKALVQLEQQDSDGAVQSFGAAIYCQRQHALASYMLGNIYYQRADKARAERSWKNAQRTLEGRADSDFVCDFSDMTVGRLRSLLEASLAAIEKSPP